MSRVSDSNEVARWQDRLERFRGSDLGVGKFCAGEGVTVASFYYWRKKLTQRSSGPGRAAKSGGFRRVAVIPAVHNVSIQLAGGTRLEVSAADLEAVRTVVSELVGTNGNPPAGVQ